MATISWIKDHLIGRLGSVVGSSWKGTYYVKKYTKPTDPHSPAQMANRNLFSKAVALAKEAMALNGNAAYWQKGIDERSERIGTAKRRLDAGAADEAAFPFYPDNYQKPTAILTDITAAFDEAAQELTITAQLTAQYFARHIKLQIHAYNSSSGNWTTSSIENEIAPSAQLLAVFPWNSANSYPAGAFAVGASTDDKQSAYGSIQFPYTALLQPQEPFIWLVVDINWLFAEYDDGGIRVNCAALPFPITLSVDIVYRVYSTYTASLEEKTLPVQF